MSLLKKYLLLGLSFFILLSTNNLSAHPGHGEIKFEKGHTKKAKIVVVTSQFILPAKLTLLRSIANSEGLELEGYVYPPSENNKYENWFVDADLIILDTPRRGLRLMTGIQEKIKETKQPWIFPRGGKVQGDNLPPELMSTLNAYYRGGGEDNFGHMMAFIRAWKSGQSTEDIPAPIELPISGYYHPESNKHFEALQDYLAWGNERWKESAPVLAIAISPNDISDGQTAVYDHLVEQIEKAEAVPLLFWYDRNHPKAITEKIAAAKPTMLTNMTHMVSADRKQELLDLNIPVVIGLGQTGSDIT